MYTCIYISYFKQCKFMYCRLYAYNNVKSCRGIWLKYKIKCLMGQTFGKESTEQQRTAQYKNIQKLKPTIAGEYE